MITNPIPKNGLFATLNANQVAGIIAGLPEEYRHAAYSIYFGTINMCQELIESQVEVLNHKDAKEYPAVTPTEDEDGIKDIDRPVVTNRRPDW